MKVTLWQSNTNAIILVVNIRVQKFKEMWKIAPNKSFHFWCLLLPSCHLATVVKKKKKTTASGHEILLMSILQMHHSELNKTIWNVTIKCKEESPINQKNVLHSKRTRSLQVRYYGSPSMMWPFDDTWKWQVDFKKHKYGPRKDILLKNLWKS